MLLIATSREKLLIARDTLIFLLQNFISGFIQRSKVTLKPTSTFEIYRRFSEYDIQSSKREGGKVKTPMEKDAAEPTANGQGTKKIVRSVIAHSSSSSLSSSLERGFTAPANSRDNFQIFSIRGVNSIKTSTAQKMKFSMKDFFNKFHQIRKKLWIWSHLLTWSKPQFAQW